MVFYFTGTGNSLYVARQIEDAPVSIPQVIHSDNLNFSADSIGIVAPVYGHEVPPMVRDFMKKSAFHTEYFYMIAKLVDSCFRKKCFFLLFFS